MVELSISSIVVVILGITAWVLFRRRTVLEHKGVEQLRLALAEGQTVPLSLHPVIDPTLCVGSFSCIKSCPEGEIIGVVDGVATLVEAAHCIGHARCAVECPVGAIKLVFGTAERGVDLPELDDSFETSRPGIYIIGELGGMGLIKNALRQGLVLGKMLKGRLKKSEVSGQGEDVVIVGAGPAGIAAASSCLEQGLTVRVLEQETLGGAIAHYPRGKVVMSEQIVMPKYGAFGRSLLSKEELLNEIRELVASNNIPLEEGQKVIRVDGAAPHFTVTTAQGRRLQCRAVVLAIGLRGSPRKLNVPGEGLPKVVYRLIDPEQYHGRHVLVVGGGDSAVEAAVQLAEESTAKVCISYRQSSFNKCKSRNRERIGKLIEEGRVKALFGTKVVAVEPRQVRLAPADDGDQSGKPTPLAPAAGAAAEAARHHDSSATSKRGRDVSVTGSFRARAIDGSGARGPSGVDGGTAAEVTKPFIEAPLVRELKPDALGAAKRDRDKKGAAGGKGLPALVESTSVRMRSLVQIIAKGRARTMAEQAAEDAEHQSSSRSMRVDTREIRLKNDDVIVCAGGELPAAFLETVGVETRRYMGDERISGGGRGLTKAEVEARSRRRLALSLFAVGASILLGLFLTGREYYWLPLEERVRSPLHDFLKPSGLWGHGVGVAATLFMLANFIYALRKRWSVLKGKASIRTWLTFHMFVGIMSPLVIAFHAAFLVNNLLAVWTWVALSVVVGTGIFGRFLFSLVPAQAGKMLAVSEIREQVADIEKVLKPHMARSKDVAQVTRVFHIARTMPAEKTFVGAVLKEPEGRKVLLKDIERAKPLFESDGEYNLFKDSLLKIARARTQISFYAVLKRVFRLWLVFHVVVAIFMVVLIGAHVAVTTYLGFGAFFFQGGK